MSNLNAGRPSKANKGSSLSLDDLVENEKIPHIINTKKTIVTNSEEKVFFLF